MRALSIRQPYAELILRGIKTVEYRSRATRIIGEPFFIYAAKGRVKKSEYRMSKSETIGNGGKSKTSGAGFGHWGLQHSKLFRASDFEIRASALPRGLLVGTAVISHCERNNGSYHWHLTKVKRLARPRKPTKMPQPVWFNPF